MFDANSSFLSQPQTKTPWNQPDQTFNQLFQPFNQPNQLTWSTVPVDGTSFTLVQADDTQWSAMVSSMNQPIIRERKRRSGCGKFCFLRSICPAFDVKKGNLFSSPTRAIHRRGNQRLSFKAKNIFGAWPIRKLQGPIYNQWIAKQHENVSYSKNLKHPKICALLSTLLNKN